MTDDNICALAVDFDAMSGDVGDLIKFARAVAAKEREACAKLCDGWPDYYVQGLAETIRARGE